MFDLTEVKYVKRITVGSENPNHICTQEEIENTTKLLNRCLNDNPKGSILATEKSFTLLQIGEHQVVLQWIVYHVGFKRKPFWLDETD
ncbi:MAG: hypothetical protein ACLFQE_08020 [Thermotogota bacterium]